MLQKNLSDQKPWQHHYGITVRMETMTIVLQEHPWQQRYGTTLKKKTMATALRNKSQTGNHSY